MSLLFKFTLTLNKFKIDPKVQIICTFFLKQLFVLGLWSYLIIGKIYSNGRFCLLFFPIKIFIVITGREPVLPQVLEKEVVEFSLPSYDEILPCLTKVLPNS